MGVLTEKVIKDEIMILIHILNDDVETQCIAREAFENVRNRDISVLTDFLDLLVDKDYQEISHRRRHSSMSRKWSVNITMFDAVR